MFLSDVTCSTSNVSNDSEASPPSDNTYTTKVDLMQTESSSDSIMTTFSTSDISRKSSCMY